MHITFDELLKYSKRTIKTITDENGNLKPEYKELIEKVNKAMKENVEIRNLVIKLQQTSDPKEIEELRNKFENKEQKLSQEEQISKQYGISLESIEHLRLKNGQEFYKFYDIKTNRDIILRQNDKNKNLSEEFKDVQKDVTYAQGDDAKANGEEVFEYQRMHTNNEVKMYAIHELENNSALLGNLTVEQMKALSTLLKNKDELQIVAINPETGIAIDRNHKVVTAELNKSKTKYEVSYPQEYRYDNDKVNESQYNDGFSDNLEESMENGDMEDIEVVNDLPTEINEVIIDKDRVRLYYEYPEVLDRDTKLTDKEKNAYLEAVKKYREGLKNKQQTKEQQKVYVKKAPKPNQNQGGYVDALLLALTTGYFGGLFTMIIYNIIK